MTKQDYLGDRASRRLDPRCRALAVAVCAAAATIAVGCGIGGHNESWKRGYNDGHEARGLTQWAVSAKAACDAQASMKAAYGAKENWNDYKAGCQAWLKEHNEG